MSSTTPPWEEPEKSLAEQLHELLTEHGFSISSCECCNGIEVKREGRSAMGVYSLGTDGVDTDKTRRERE